MSDQDEDIIDAVLIDDDAEAWRPPSSLTTEDIVTLLRGSTENLRAVAREAVAHIADLAGQIDALAEFIVEQVPGEPSESQGAIETAIRLLRTAYATPAEREAHLLTWAISLMSGALTYLPTVHEREAFYAEISEWKKAARRWLDVVHDHRELFEDETPAEDARR